MNDKVEIKQAAWDFLFYSYFGFESKELKDKEPEGKETVRKKCVR